MNPRVQIDDPITHVAGPAVILEVVEAVQRDVFMSTTGRVFRHDQEGTAWARGYFLPETDEVKALRAAAAMEEHSGVAVAPAVPTFAQPPPFLPAPPAPLPASPSPGYIGIVPAGPMTVPNTGGLGVPGIGDVVIGTTTGPLAPTAPPPIVAKPFPGHIQRKT